MCAGGVVCKGEMEIVIIVHTGTVGKSGCMTNRNCENISKVIFFVLLPQHTRPASQEEKWGLNTQHRRDRKVS